MKTKEEVIEWLKSQEWFEQFRTNTEKYKPFEEYIETYSNVLLFISAFPWYKHLKEKIIGTKKIVIFKFGGKVETIEDNRR